MRIRRALSRLFRPAQKPARDSDGRFATEHRAMGLPPDPILNPFGDDE